MPAINDKFPPTSAFRVPGGCIRLETEATSHVGLQAPIYRTKLKIEHQFEGGDRVACEQTPWLICGRVGREALRSDEVLKRANNSKHTRRAGSAFDEISTLGTLKELLARSI